MTSLCNSLLAGGLADEPYLMVGATALGGGTPAFGAESVPDLRPVDSGNVLLRYERPGRDAAIRPGGTRPA